MQNIKGLRWYKTDLHLHTTASSCFKDQSVTAEQWVERCLEQGLQCVAVTDHNTGVGIDKIKEAALGKLIVFPGVEVTCSDAKVHLLVLFNPDKGSDHVTAFLNSLDLLPEDHGAKDAYIGHSISHVIEKAKYYNGLVIPAHIDQYNGLGNVSPSVRTELLENHDILGLQVVHNFLFDEENHSDQVLQENFNEIYGNVPLEEWKKWKKASDQVKVSAIAKLTFSDNPDSEQSPLHGLAGIGTRYTWIKMGEIVTLESLRQALLMGDFRIKNDFEIQSIENFNPLYSIEKIEIRDSIYNKNETDTIYFNPQLTTIIGGRGTGKSSIIRLLRGILNLSSEISNSKDLHEEQSKFFQINNGKEGVLKENSVIKLFYNHDEIKFEIELKFQNKANEYCTKICYQNGDFKEYGHDETISLLDEISVSLFSQKQIYEIAQNPNSLREFIDTNSSEISYLKSELEKQITHFKEINFEISNLENELTKKTALEVKLADLLIKSEKANNPLIKEQLKNLNAFQMEKDELNRFFKAIDDQAIELHTLIHKIMPQLDINKFRSNYSTNFDKVNVMFNKKMVEINQILMEQYTEIKNVYTELLTEVKSNNWNAEFLAFSTQYQDFESSNGNVQQLIQEKEYIDSEIKEITTQLDKLNAAQEKNIQLSAELETVYNSIVQIRRNIARKRRDFIKETLGDSPYLKVHVKEFRDVNSFTDLFRAFIKKESAYQTEVETIREFCFNGDLINNLKILSQELNAVYSEESSSIQLNQRFNSIIRSLSPLELREIILLIPEDTIEIQYRLNQNSQFKSLNNASAGQKTSSILTLILSSGTSPLILDQPEDDLDNSLIYSLIVERILKSKSKRQIIVVTHNANIPVNADSELINVMDSDNLAYQPKLYGSIEDQPIKDSICDIMEGGIEAFKLRATKYKIY